MTDEIGKWYEDKQKEAEMIENKIEKLKHQTVVVSCSCTKVRMCSSCDNIDKELKRLNRQLEMARYVGD